MSEAYVNIMKMKFLPDEPILASATDRLSVAKFVQLVHTSLQNTTPPFVFGVLGDWGSGKTSILRLLEDQLNNSLATLKMGTPVLVPIWFNAWLYENEANLIYPLLYAIRASYSKRVPSAGEELQKSFLKVVKSSALALVDVGLRAATKHLTGEALKLADVQEAIKTVEEQPDQLDKVLSTWADQVSELHEAFEHLLEMYASKLCSANEEYQVDQVRFVIIVDDLDRCMPQTAVAILESIKNYLTAKNVIFILAINPRVISNGIKSKYQGVDIDGRQYLEKIINYSFYVPIPELADVAAFAVAELKQLLLEPTPQLMKSIQVFGEVLEETSFANPRKIKRILNRYLLFLGMNESKLIYFNMKNIGKLIVMAEYFPELFMLFLGNGEQVKRDLNKLGTQEFDVKKFEASRGVSIDAHIQELIGMAKLFELSISADREKATLSEEAKAVHSVSRLV